MTLLQKTWTAGIVIFAVLFCGFFLGNQRLAFADSLGGDIVCLVFDINNGVGVPLPVLSGGECQNEPSAPSQCTDGLDNDGDALVDLDDPGCSDESDNSEFNPPSEDVLALCIDESDNDGDSLIDLDDPDCGAFIPTLTVTKIVVNDDGGEKDVADFALFIDGVPTLSGVATSTSPGGHAVSETADSGYTGVFGGDCTADGSITLAAGDSKTCTITNDDIEIPPAPQCSDGIDNDSDELIDELDPSCHSDFDPENSASYDPEGSDESAAETPSTTDLCPNIEGPQAEIPSGKGLDSEGDCVDDESPQEGGGGGGGGGGGSGSPGGLIFFTAAPSSTEPQGQVLGAATSTVESCDAYLSAFLRAGRENNEDQVRRLQRFLRDFEGMKIAETGVFDDETVAAVHAFQQKYAADVLYPWGIRTSTGYVYLTTRKKVNELYCRGLSQFPLSSREQEIIARSSTASVVSEVPEQHQVEPTTPAREQEIENVQPTSSPQTAAAAGTGEGSPTKGIWRFILDGLRKLFGR